MLQETSLLSTPYGYTTIEMASSYRLDQFGSGLTQFFLVLTQAAMRTPSFILIDEPELNLHASLQLDFLTTLTSYATEGILFATHSMGLARASTNQIYSFRRNADGQSEVHEYDAMPRLSEFLGELGFAGYKELGFDKILLVEGATDVKTFHQFLRLYGKDHQIVLLPLGGNQLISRVSEIELLEIKRISDNISAVIDSELASPHVALEPARVSFLQVCKKVGIGCHVLDCRATENYFTDQAIKKVMGSKYSALEPYERLSDASHGWAKADNWRIAREMSREELDTTDLGVFLQSL